MFRAPIRIDGKLTEAELLSRAPSEPTDAKPRGKVDFMLMLPAFGLLLCGIVGSVINGTMCYRVYSDPAAAKQMVKEQVEAAKRFNAQPKADTPEKQAEQDEQNTAQLLKLYQWMFPVFLGVSVLVLCGGLAMVLRRGYRLSQLACVVAMLNFAHLCCLPGAVFGIWGLLMLSSSEARDHFRR
jgi:hypothetical protein